MNFTYLKELLLKLKKLDEGMFVLGADFHEYNLHPCLVENDIVSVEENFNIYLPEDYQNFLIFFGNGGAGPDYGIYRLKQSIDKALESNWRISEKSLLTLESYCIVENIFEDENDNTSWMYNGCLPIAMAEVNSFYFLILNGKRTGEVWLSDNGLIKLCAANFSDWYQKWLSISLVTTAVSSIKDHFMVYGEVDTILYEYYDIRLYFEEIHENLDNIWMLNLLLPIGKIHAIEGLAWLYLCEENHIIAFKFFRHLYESKDEKLKAAGGHGMWAVYILQGRIRDALRIGEVALAVSRFCNDVQRIYELQYGLSLTYAVLSRKEDALKAAEELIEIFPIINASFEVLASLHIKFNNKTMAKKSIARLIANNPSRKNHYSRKLWHIYRQIGATDWSHWIAQIIGCKDEKKMIQKIESRREELKRIILEKFGDISLFSKEEILKINYIDELEVLIKTVITSDTLEEFEIKLLQYTR